MDIVFDNIRTQQKYEDSSKWEEFGVPLKGEMIIYGKDTLTGIPRIKIGDANGTPLKNLPFINDRITDEELDEICI